MKRGALFTVLLVVLAFSLSTWLQPRLPRAAGGRDSENVFKVLFGEGRRMFANHFAVKADVYLHSGFYPSIFDQVKQGDPGHEEPGHVHDEHCNHEHAAEPADAHADEHASHDAHDDHDDHASEAGAGLHEDHDCDASFMGEPRDWIERMGRHFMITEHTHLEGAKAREILPWLKLSAQLDPQRIETYTVAGYWLAERMDKPKEAEEFLRDGLRANPQSYEILYYLGRIYERNFKQPDRARNVWRLALRRWVEVEGNSKSPDKNSVNSILGNLAELELEQGNLFEAIGYFQAAKKFSPLPDAIQDRIDDIWLRFTLPPQSATSATH